MDTKEIKLALKNARESIRNKDFKEVMKHCKMVLQIDKENYNALIFVGVATQELGQTEQALKAFKKAINVNPDQPLAWQGLATFYEKVNEPEHRSDLAEVYNKLIEFSNETDKTFDWITKLMQLYFKSGNKNQALEKFHLLTSLWKNDKNKEITSWSYLAKFLRDEQNLTEEELNLLETALSNVIGEVFDENHQKNLESYIKLLLKKGKQREAISQARKTLEDYPDSVVALETLCEVYLDLTINLVLPPEEIQRACEQLSLIDESSSAIHIIQGLIALVEKDFLKAKEDLTAAIKLCPDKPVPWFHLARTYLSIHNYPKAEKTAFQGLKLLKSNINNFKNLYRELSLILSQALQYQALPSTLEEAITILNKLLLDHEEDVNILSSLGYAYLQNGDEGKVEEILDQRPYDDHRMLSLHAWLHFRRKEYPDAEACIQKTLANGNEENSWYLHQMGRILWSKSVNKNEKNASAIYFLKAAKLDPYFSDTFLYLGHIYREIGNDLEKTKRCYQKAFELNRSSNEAGAALSDAFRALGDEESNLALLSLVTTEAHAGTAKWAWLRLGLHYVKTNEPTSAVTALQNAIRIDPTDSCCWECLAEAYMTRGSFTASLKAFTRALELNPSVYCLYQMAAIKHLLGSFSEAEAEYKAILRCSPDYIPALAGLAQSLLAQAQSSLNKYLSGRTIDFCQQAIFVLTRAVVIRPDISCLWKSLGDACTIIHCLPSEIVQLIIPNKLFHRTSSTSEKQVMNKLEALSLGAKFYGRALRLLSDLGSLWHDLGENYFRQAENSPVDKASELITKALDAMKKAISLEPSNHNHWNSLGNIAASVVENDLALAQHAFIKSIQMEPNNAVAWTNLGALYLKAKNIELAHQAFKIAQALEPSYVACWIGQAIIAETINHEDAMDLFRHTTELAPHTEGGLGYGNWVCKTLLDLNIRNSQNYKTNIVEMRAIPQASLHLAKYIGRCQTNAGAFNIYGLLLEQENLYINAAKAYQRTVQLLEKEKPSIELDYARLNYARVLSILGKAEEAIKQYQKIRSVADFNSICGLALAMYQAGNLRESSQMYEQAAKIASSDADLSHTLVGLALAAYKMRDIEKAKTAFFQSFQKSISVQSLQGLCALGIVTDDFTLATATAKELMKCPWDDYSPDSYFLITTLSAMQKNYVNGEKQLAHMIHRYPTCASLWLQQAEYLLHFNVKCAYAAALSAVRAEQTQFNISKDLPAIMSLCYLASGLVKQALKAAQSAVHLYPDNIQNWSALALANYSVAVVDQSSLKFEITQNLFNFLTLQVENQLTLGDESLNSLWKTFMLYCLVSELHLKNWTQCDKLLHQITIICQAGDQELLNSVLFFQLLKDCLLAVDKGHIKNAPLEDLKRAVTTYPKALFAVEALVVLLNAIGQSNKAEIFLKEWLRKSELYTSQKKVGLLMLLALSTFTQAKNSNDQAMLCYSSLSDVLKINPGCSSAYLIQAILQMKERKKAAKKSFDKVLANKNYYNLPDPILIASHYANRLKN